LRYVFFRDYFMKKKRTWFIIGIIIIIIVVLVIVFMSKSATTVNNYAIEKVKKGDISQMVSASGSINPENMYNLSPRTNAKVIEVNVKTGDKVVKSQQLARVDDTDLQSAIKAAQYSFNSAVYARDKLKALPIVDDYAVKQAQQQINITSVQLETAKRNLNNTKIESPIDGQVLAVNIKVDEYASVTSPTPAFIVGNTQNLLAFLNVNEIDIIKVKAEQKVDLTIDAIGKTLSGKIFRIDDNGVNVAGIIYYKVQATLEDTTSVKPNMTVNSEINVESRIGVLTLPSSAITQKQEKNYVRLAKYNDKGVLSPEEKEIQIGINNNSIVEILSGLNEGDEVVIMSSSKQSALPFGLGGSN